MTMDELKYKDGKFTVNGADMSSISATSIISETKDFEILENNEWLEVSTDKNNKILKGLKKDGKFYINSLDCKEIYDEFSTINERIDEIHVKYCPWEGKKLLTIGDSITAPGIWTKKVGEILNMSVQQHAQGGIGILAMVDGHKKTQHISASGDGVTLTAYFTLGSEDVVYQLSGATKMFDLNDNEVTTITDLTPYIIKESGDYKFTIESEKESGEIVIVTNELKPDNYNPHGINSHVYRLQSEDVEGVDVIVAHGFYNERPVPVTSDMGTEHDMYPHQNTFCGRLNYLVYRIYECLEIAGNKTCKIYLSTPHKYGKYDYNGSSAYADGEIMYENIKKIANRHSLYLIDCMHGTNINMYNWDVFQAKNYDANPNYLPAYGENDATVRSFDTLSEDGTKMIKDGFIAKASDYTQYQATLKSDEIYDGLRVKCYYVSDGNVWVKTTGKTAPWCVDQLHCSIAGYERIGEFIAAQLRSSI